MTKVANKMKIQKEVGTFYTIRKKRYQYQEVCRMDQLKKLGLYRRRNSALKKRVFGLDRIGRLGFAPRENGGKNSRL